MFFVTFLYATLKETRNPADLSCYVAGPTTVWRNKGPDRQAKYKGARERRSKEAGILQRKNSLKLISEGVCIHQITACFKRLVSSEPFNKRFPL